MAQKAFGGINICSDWQGGWVGGDHFTRKAEGRRREPLLFCCAMLFFYILGPSPMLGGKASPSQADLLYGDAIGYGAILRRTPWITNA